MKGLSSYMVYSINLHFSMILHSFICFIYSYPPFFDENTFKIYEKILEGKIEWPRHLDPAAKYVWLKTPYLLNFILNKKK